MDSTIDDQDAAMLRRAIELSARAREAGDHPFGSLLVTADGRVQAEAVNTVVTGNDISAHPELKLAVWAAGHLSEEEIAATTMYTSCEPCVMCSGGMVSSGLSRLVYALSGAQAHALRTGDAPAEWIAAGEVFERAGRSLHAAGPALHAEAARTHEGYWT